MKDRIKAYYAEFGEREWNRLLNPTDGAVEFAVNRRAISRYLPTSLDSAQPLRILDIGGGPGRYSFWLVEQGHKVTLADLSPDLLKIARAKSDESHTQLEAVVEADACDLSAWPTGYFDAVLSLGPFYHLPDAADRDRAAGELGRVLRPGGVAFVALMPRYTFLRRTIAIGDERQHLLDADFLREALEQGAFYNDIPGRFTEGYGAHPAEIEPYFARFGLEQVTLLASEGIAVGIQEAVAQIADTAPALYERVIDLILETATDPSILGLCSHLLYVGQKTDISS
jgi:SAM-dependent methyltransferase